MTEREFATAVVRKLQDAGFTAYWAGGCVRDELLGFTPADYDVASNATPETVQRIFPHTVAIGASFGVIEVIGPKVQGEWRKVQVATFRRDGSYSDGRRPDAVVYSTAEEDAQRRDFTINGLFYDPVAEQLHDYIGGQADLKAKVLRAIGDATARFEEDKLRVLRAVRMATRFDLAIDAATLQAGKAIAAKITVVSAERIAEELRKLLTHPQRVRGLELLCDFGLVEYILPEIANEYDTSIRTLKSLVFDPDADWIVALAAMFHTRPLREVKVFIRRLKLSNDESDRLIWILAHRAELHEPLLPSRIYPLLAHEGWRSLYSVAMAIATAEGEPTAFLDECFAMCQLKSPDELNPPPLLTGDDLLAKGWPGGPQFKAALEAVRAAQLNGDVTNEVGAIELAGRFFPK